MAQGDGRGSTRAARAERRADSPGSNGRAPFRAPPAAGPAGSVGLIARDRELADLDQALRQCRLGEAMVVVLRGEPGVGKSALIEATVARARDFHVVQLRAGEIEEPEQLPAGWPRPLVELFELASSNGGRIEPSRLAAVVDGLAVYPMAPLLLTIDDAQLLPPWFLEALVVAVRGLDEPSVRADPLGDRQPSHARDRASGGVRHPTARGPES